MQFTALEDFWSDEMQSQYCAGLSYTVDKDNQKLAGLVKRWIRARKVALGGPVAQISGKG